MRWSCADVPQLPKRNSLINCSVTGSATSGGPHSRPAVPACNARCGHRRQRRTRHTPTPCTSTISSARIRSTPLPETTITTFEDHGTVARTIDLDIDDASAVLDGLSRVGIDLADVGRTLEDQGVAGFHDSFAHVLETLTTKARHLTAH